MSKVNEDQDQSHDASLGDLTTMTIECLRTRLLSERAISRSAKQRADDLAKRVVELEEQLKIVSMQRKKAEKATADVLAILESNGISDDSDVYDSCSDREMSVSESKLSNESARRKEALTDFRERRNDPDTYSSSEIDSSSTAGSLSWKSHKDSRNYPERKKNIDSIRRRCSSFGSSGSLPTRHGKSCRRIRRKEARSQSEELRDNNLHGIHEDSLGADHQNHPNGHSISAVTLKKEPEKHKVNDLTEPLVSEASGTPETEVDTANVSPRNEHAQGLITVQAHRTVGFETELKDKLKENNGHVSESHDPDRSIVTENKDEIRVPNESVADPIPNPNQETQSVSMETDFSFKPEILTNPPETPLFNNGQKHDTKNHNKSKLESSSSDIALPRSIEFHGQVLNNGESSRNTNEFTLKPEKSSNDLGSVLNALQLAKLSLTHKLSTKSVSDDGFSVMKDSHPSIPVTRTNRTIETPIGCPPVLFRSPVDFQFQKPSIARGQSVSIPYPEPRSDPFAGDIPQTNHMFSGAHNSVYPSNTRSRTYTNTPQYIESHSRIYTGATPHRIELRSGMYSTLSTKNIDFTPTLNDKRVTERSTYLDPRMNVGYPFSSNYTYHPPSYPSSPDVTPQQSLSNRFSSEAYGVALRMPSNGQFSSYGGGDQIRHNLYK